LKAHALAKTKELSKLCAQHGYGLAAVSDGSCDAFFTRTGSLNSAEHWKPKRFREQFSGIPRQKRWDEVKHLPFVAV
jgi:hypothetical protein